MGRTKESIKKRDASATADDGVVIIPSKVRKAAALLVDYLEDDSEGKALVCADGQLLVYAPARVALHVLRAMPISR